MLKNHILAVIGHYFPHVGGAEAHLAQISNALTHYGYKITVLTTRQGDTPYQEVINDVNIYRFDNFSNGEEVGFLSIKKWIEFNDLENAISYIFLNVGASNRRTEETIEIMTLLRTKGVPTLVRITSSGRVKKLAQVCPKGISELKCASKVIALNQGIYEELIDAGIKCQNIHSVPNGVDINYFFPADEKRKIRIRHEKANIECRDTDIIFFCPARLDPKKKLFDLIDLWESMYSQGMIESYIKLLIVGGRRDNLQDFMSLKDHVLSLNLGKTIILTPEVPHHEIASFFQMSDFYISLSSEEGMSNAMLEALACGLPVIAPDIPAVTDVVTHTVHGFVFSCLDVSTAKKSVLDALKLSRDEKSRICDANTSLIHSRYNIDDVAKTFSNIFCELSL